MHQPLAQLLRCCRFAVHLLLFALVCSQRSYAETVPETPLSSTALWERTVATLQDMQIADPANAYDASHYLMIPMHAAFETKDFAAQKFFADLVSRLQESTYDGLNLLTRMQLDYFLTEYLVLKASNGPLDPASQALLNRQWSKFDQYWVDSPFKHWSSQPFHGIRGRLTKILSGSDFGNGKSYLNTVTDFELFGLAIAADLGFVSRETGKAPPGNSEFLANEATRMAATLVRTKGEFLEDGWLFQKGAWRDHGDFIYAGNPVLGPELSPLPVNDIAQDSSHSIRWAFWIRSFYRGTREDADRQLYRNVAKALSAQYRRKVIKHATGGLTMTNYMDGRNGVYRYKHATVGSNNLDGYGPYGLSGSLFIGWLCFLPDMGPTMSAMADSFPLPPDMVDLYTGPNTTRIRNPLFTQPAIYTNGFAELVASLSVGCAANSDSFWDKQE